METFLKEDNACRYHLTQESVSQEIQRLLRFIKVNNDKVTYNWVSFIMTWTSEGHIDLTFRGIYAGDASASMDNGFKFRYNFDRFKSDMALPVIFHFLSKTIIDNKYTISGKFWIGETEKVQPGKYFTFSLSKISYVNQMIDISTSILARFDELGIGPDIGKILFPRNLLDIPTSQDDKLYHMNYRGNRIEYRLVLRKDGTPFLTYRNQERDMIYIDPETGEFQSKYAITGQDIEDMLRSDDQIDHISDLWIEKFVVEKQRAIFIKMFDQTFIEGEYNTDVAPDSASDTASNTVIMSQMSPYIMKHLVPLMDFLK